MDTGLARDRVHRRDRPRSIALEAHHAHAHHRVDDPRGGSSDDISRRIDAT
ncbi:hypothetical protein [Xanthomonas sp. XNM01]|uniref:hypothetical protein n=1 Tax=Xanthomonas sp. XNM01 TaxID=2769289 RepID=UPI00177CC089|nr:hypothetical protein [Xanthomonas sp. XNM01]MBD9368457.1 hypothetical protein [Xanthomonas sp. XNM01]